MMGLTVVTSACILILFTGHISDVSSSAGNVWKYRGSLGPDHWHLDYPHCGGTKQSPISVISDDVVVDKDRLTPIEFSGYHIIGNVNMTLENNGHTVQVDLHDESNTISEGGLPGKFIAKQFHFHWGADDSRGSEHDINGHHFPMEMHFVHYNKKYGDFGTAVDKTDGLAVLGFFFEVGRHNPHFQQLIKHFEAIKYKGTFADFDSIPLSEFIPDDLSRYYRYDGSLTTPPCYESVTWTLFNDTIEIAEEQLEKFRTTVFENDQSDEGGVSMDISDDFRPIQCMFRRKVYASNPALKFPHRRHSGGGGRSGESTSDAAATELPTTVLMILLFFTALRAYL